MNNPDAKKTVFRWINVFLITLSACTHSTKKESPVNLPAIDLPQIKEKKELTAVTLNASTSYFIYKMQPMGYEYDLIEDFTASQGLSLKIKVAENITRLEEMLQAGEADLVAYPVHMDHTM
jgi:membrane-bound lytic murein transglycosylase F